jgi:hypothetical protein
MKKIFISILVILYAIKIKADIAPNPIQAKGISVKYPTEIKMTYEKVTVYLTLDSSFVHCYFKLHNEGKAEKIEIGYPYMNTSPYTLPNSTFAPINVYQNGKRIDDIKMFETDSRSPKTNINSWYLWNTYFDENETIVIKVSYSLPHGIVKNDLYYKFDYLLSTGSGWKGKIDTAEIIVNLKNFDKNLILKTSPENFTVSDKQLIWKFYNIEPTIKDDISIKYEKESGQYAKRLKNGPTAVMILDEKTILSNDIRDPENTDSLNPLEIVSIKVIKDSEKVKMKFPNIDSSKGLVLIYSDKFIPVRLIGILNSKMAGNNKERIKLIPLSEFKDKYSLDINGQIIKKENIPNEILNIDEFKISEVLIKNLKENKYQISIWTNQ